MERFLICNFIYLICNECKDLSMLSRHLNDIHVVFQKMNRNCLVLSWGHFVSYFTSTEHFLPYISRNPAVLI